MFKRILIANRGEIACRIIKTARKMGIATVAVYSDADRDALHVEMADEAVHIGPPAAAESYLLIDKIVAACKADRRGGGASGLRLPLRARGLPARAGGGRHRVHRAEPGRDRRDGRQDRVARRPPPNAKVSTVPGHLGVIDDEKHAVKIADEIGYPVMIKASAGGGGKGMRIAWSQGEVAEGFARSKSEAKSSFGDDRMFIEKFIVDPRHIEIQVLGDKHGNVIYLGERECSIQRRNQKVIEEAPSPLLDAATRKKMGEQAVALAKAVGYDSRRHGRVRRRAGPQLLLPRDEHAAAGRASGDRIDHRHRSGRADDPRRGGREAQAQAERREAHRLGGREPRLCRRPDAQLPALDRAAHHLPAAGGEATRTASRCATTPASTRAARSRSGTTR